MPKNNKNKQTQKLLWDTIHPLVSETINPYEVAKLRNEELPHYVAQLIDQTARQLKIKLNEELHQYLKTRLLHEIEGFGPIEPLMQDPHITDILINSPTEIYIERLGQLERTDITFRNKDHLMHLLLRALSTAGRNIDTTKPFVDAILPDGSRINAVMNPLVRNGPVVSIRKFGRERFTLQQLVENKFIHEKAAHYLSLATRLNLNILISGGAGSGKTTLLNALLNEITAAQRMIVIEDTAELELGKKHAIRLLTRPPNIEGKGKITQRDLLRNSLRMRPDRIIVGEIRGDEVMDMFQAMNTGYDGSLSTVHASYTHEVPIRLANLATMTGLEISTDFVIHQISACIHVFVHLGRFYDGKRRVMEISEVAGYKEKQVLLNHIYRHQYDAARNDFVTTLTFEQIKALSLQRASQFGLAKELIRELRP